MKGKGRRMSATVSSVVSLHKSLFLPAASCLLVAVDLKMFVREIEESNNFFIIFSL